MATAEEKVVENASNATEEIISSETSELFKDVEGGIEHAEKQIDKETEKLDKEVQDLHVDAKEEATEIKEDVKEHITTYSRFIAMALYLCGCASALMKRNDEDNAKPEEKEELKAEEKSENIRVAEEAK